MVFNRHHYDAPDHAIYAGRGTKWGNPFHFPTEFCPTREEAVECFRIHLTAGEGKDLDLMELIGVPLICSCYPYLCHCDVIREELRQMLIYLTSTKEERDAKH